MGRGEGGMGKVKVLNGRLINRHYSLVFMICTVAKECKMRNPKPCKFFVFYGR
jgi:hypothetical protein